MAGVTPVPALTGVTISLLQWEKVARFTATDEVLLQYIAETNPISLCSHPYFRQKLNREVRHSLTWHSSKSESALERFEPDHGAERAMKLAERALQIIAVIVKIMTDIGGWM